jgi:hypothetical protein
MQTDPVHTLELAKLEVAKSEKLPVFKRYSSECKATTRRWRGNNGGN